jgi:outer membrane protein
MRLLSMVAVGLGLLTGTVAAAPTPVGNPVAPASPAAPSPQPLTLEHAMHVALTTHPTAMRYDELVAVAAAHVQHSYSGLLPHVYFEAAEKSGPPAVPSFGSAGLINSGSMRGFGADVVLSQMYDFGQTVHRTQAQRHSLQAAQADAEGQRALLLLAVCKDYDEALLAQRLWTLAQSTMQARQTTAEQAFARFSTGLVTRVDVGLARSALAEAQALEVQARNAVQVAYDVLADAIGSEPLARYVLSEPDPAPDSLSSTLEQDVAEALACRPEIHSQLAAIEAARHTLMAATDERMPTLRLLAAGGYAHDVPGTPDPHHGLGVNLTLPIFSGGFIQSDVDEAKHQLRALQDSEDELVHSVRLEVARARLGYQTLLESRAAIAEQVRQAADAERLASLRYEHKLGNIVEVQQAQLGLLSAQTSEAQLHYNLRTAYAALRYARGTLLPASGGEKK